MYKNSVTKSPFIHFQDIQSIVSGKINVYSGKVRRESSENDLYRGLAVRLNRFDSRVEASEANI